MQQQEGERLDLRRLDVYRRLLGYMKPYWRQVLLGYIAMLAVILFNLYVPQIVKNAINAIDSGPEEQRARALFFAGGVILGLALVRGVAGFAQRFYGLWLSHRFSYDIRNQFFQRIQALSFTFHDQTQTGDIMSRVTGDISETERFVGFGLLELSYSLLMLGGVVVALLLEDLRLALLGLGPIVLLVALTIRFGSIVRPRFKEIQEQLGVLSSTMQESLTGIRVVKAFAREPYELEKFDKENEQWFARRFGLIQIWANNWPLFTFLLVVSIFLLLWFGGPLALAGEISVGSLGAMAFYLSMLNGPVQRLGFLVNLAASAGGSASRAFEIIDDDEEILEKADALVLGEIEGKVTFEHVSFGYHTEQQILDDLSFEAHPNQTTALIGPTGSGKSTIINLIPRFYDVDGGRVLIDGHDVRDVTKDSLRDHIGIVLQDSFLFSSTIAENIAYGRPDASPEEIETAAKAARAHDFIMEFPEGYETHVGERGVTLSGGQKQRVAIARALLTDPDILILDDSLSNVDTETEHLIQEALDKLMENRTTFIIAQRLVSLKNADCILVIDQGRLVERGTHEELLARGGLYKEIYDLQLKDQEDFMELQERLALEAAD